jgi:hypothetical protein
MKKIRNYPIALGFSFLGLVLPLLIFMLIGDNMRYSGDDYCYAANLTERGFFWSQVAVYGQNLYSYNGNRVSLNLFSALADLAGPYASGVWPALVILLWCLGLWMILRLGIKWAGFEIPLLAQIVAVLVVVFFTLSLSPDIDQSLFWRTGMLTYLAPLLASTFLCALLLRQVSAASLRLSSLVLVFLVALLGAGFSETGGLVQLAWLGLVLLVALGLYWRRAADRRKLRQMLIVLGVAFLATLASLALLAFSPVVTLLRPELSQPPDVMGNLQLSMLFARRFLSTLKTAPVQNLLPAVMFAALTVLAVRRLPSVKKVRFASIIAILLGLAVAAYLLIVSSMVAYVVVQKAYPEPRAVVIPRYLLTLAEAAAGFLLGILILKFNQNEKRSSWAAFLAAIVLVACLVYPLWIGRVYWGELPRYQRWADFWDSRDQLLRQSRQEGKLDVHVIVIDHIIPRVGELTPRPGDLYNQCAAVVYHLDSIIADLPGWDQ